MRRRFDEGQHRVGPFVRDVGTSCPEDAAPMLAQSARSLVRVKHRSILTVRNSMVCAFGVFDRAISFSAWLTSRPRSSSSLARVLSLVRLSMTVQRARTLTHSTQCWSKHLATGSQDSQHCFAVGHSGCCTTNRKHGKTLFRLGSWKVVWLISTGTSTGKYVPKPDTGRSSS